jgi:hypothetical protein
MSEFDDRQLVLIRLNIANFRAKEISLSHLIWNIEGLAKVIGEVFWADTIFPHVLNLESINSELIDKKRDATPLELSTIEESLKAIEKISMNEI